MNRFYFLGTVLLLSLLAGCSSNPKPLNPTPTQPDNYAASNPTSLYYYSMAESALMTGDTPLGLAMLERADEAAPQNIFIKEEIINLLSILAYNDVEFNQEIINRTNRYIAEDNYSTTILSKAATANANLNNNEAAEKLFLKAIEEKPSMWLYLAYYHFKGSSTGKSETDLLITALKQPWEKEEIVLMAINALLRSDVDAALEATRKGYDKWDDVNFFRELISGLVARNEKDEVLRLIEDRLDRGRPTPDNYLSYLFGTYFTTLQFEKILKYKELALISDNSDLWRMLFFAAAAKNDYSTAIYTGNLLEDTQQIPAELRVLFYNEFSLIYFSQGNYAKCAEYLTKNEDWEVMSEFFSYAPDTTKTSAYLELFDEFAKDSTNPNRTNFILGTILTYLAEPEGLAYFDKISVDYLLQENLALDVIINHLRFKTDMPTVYSLMDDLRNQGDEENNLPAADEFIGVYFYESANDSMAFQHLKKGVLEKQEMSKQAYLILSSLAERLSLEKEVVELLYMGTQQWKDAEMLNIFGYFVANKKISNWFNEAEKALLEAIKLDPENPMIWDSLAWLYYSEDKHEEALSAMKFPRKLVNTESEIAYHLGMILFKLNRKDEAKSNFLKAVEINNQQDAVERSNIILKNQY